MSARVQQTIARRGLRIGPAKEPIEPLNPDVIRLIEAIARDLAREDHAREMGEAGYND